MPVFYHNGQETEYTSFEAVTLEEHILKAIQEEIGETEESKTECLQILRKKLLEIQCMECCEDEDFLLKFLRVAKFDCEKAFNRIKGFYNMQEKLVGLLKNTTIPISIVRNMKYTFGLPYRLKDSSALTIAKIGAIDYSKITFEGRSYLDIIATTGNLINNPITQMCGITMIYDFADFKFSSLLAVNPKTAIDYMYNLQNSFPIRVKSIHIINAPFIFWAFYKMFYPAMSQKLRKRVCVHPNNDDWKSLHSCIPPEVLPEDLGGHLPKSCLIDLLRNFETIEKETLKQFRFGFKKTKHARMSMKIIVPDK